MCGITGSFGSKRDFAWVNAELLHLIHRGPDFQGTYTDDSYLTMGCARLAMTDPLPRSNQPFLLNKGRQILTFNGEIYNHRKLRRELEDIGIEFKTNSDTEVLGQWLLTYGPIGVNELEGMFAFAFFNKEDQTLILGRDSLGKKPLYWSKKKDCVTWSSSIVRMGEPEFNQEGLVSYLSFGYTIDPITIKKQVQAVKPGEIIMFERNLNLNSWNFSRYPIREQTQLGENYSASLREKIITAVSDRTTGHGDVALSLSGGIDSAVIAICLKELGVKPVCFSAQWLDSDKERYNTDAVFASKIAKSLDFDFVPVDMMKKHQLAEELKSYVLAMEEPNNNPTGISMMRLYQRVAQMGFRLILTGDGSDEIFAGYPRHQLTSKYRFPNTRFFDGIENFAISRPVEKRSLASQIIPHIVSSESATSWIYWHQVFSPSEIFRLLNFSGSRNIANMLKDRVAATCKLEPNQTRLRNLMDRDHQIWLVNESNRKMDRISMFHSIEARSPFQDEKVIDHAIGISRMDVTSQMEKAELRKAFPELKRFGVREDKAGFISPVGHWLRGNSLFLRREIDSLVKYGYINKEAVSNYLGAENQGDFHQIKKLWTLLVLAAWVKSLIHE